MESTYLSQIQHDQLEQINSIEIQFNQKSYFVNGPLFCCLCLNSVHPYLSDHPFIVESPKDCNETEFQQLFTDILNLYQGQMIDLSSYDISTIRSACISFGIIHFLEFLQNPFNDEEVIDMISKIFYLFPIEFFSNFNVTQLDQIISSQYLHLWNENRFLPCTLR